MASLTIPGVATSRAITSSVVIASSSAAPAVSSAAAPPAASSSARPVSTAPLAPSSSAAAPASSTAAAPAPASSSAAAAVSSSAAAPASSSQAPASSSVIASSSSVASSSSITSRPASSSSSSSASRSSTASSSIGIIDSSSSSSDTGTRTLSGGTIGAIAGGVAGGLLLIALVWTCWRRVKSRRDRVPPPPPRDMSYNPHMGGGRSVSGGMMEQGLSPGVGMGRQSSYATLLHNVPSEQVSRQPSYYTTYPIATPSGDGSPLNISPEFNPIEDPSMIGAGIPAAAGMAGIGSGMISTAPTSPRENRPRTAESDSLASPQRMSRRVPSVDRLRLEAAGLPLPSDRAPSPSPSNLQFPSPRPAPYPISEHSPQYSGETTPPSPSVSSTGYPSRSSSSPLLNAGYRPGSMSSLSSRNYLHVGPARGAPHQGRPVQLEMPKPLSKGGADIGEGLGSPLSQGGEWKRNSGRTGDFTPYNPNQHRRIPSEQSISGYSTQSRPRTSQSYVQGSGALAPGQASPSMSGPRPGPVG